MTNKPLKTAEVPVKWLEQLMKLGKEAKVEVYSTGVMNGHRTNTTKLDHLKGYIESAEFFIEAKLSEHFNGEGE